MKGTREDDSLSFESYTAPDDDLELFKAINSGLRKAGMGTQTGNCDHVLNLDRLHFQGGVIALTLVFRRVKQLG